MRSHSLLISLSLILINSVYAQSDEQKGFVEIFAQVEDRALYVEGNKVAILDTAGNQLTPLLPLKGNYESVFMWDGYLYARRDESFTLINEDNKMGVFNVNGDMLMDFIYDTIRTVEVVEQYETIDYLFVVREGKQYVFKDTANRTMFDGFSFDIDGGKWLNSEIYVVIKDGKAKFVDLLQMTIDDKAPGYLKYNTSKIFSPTGVGMVNKMGDVLFPFEYDQIGFYSEHSPYFQIKKDNKTGVAHFPNEIILPMSYEQVRYQCGHHNFDDDFELFLIVQKEKGGPFTLAVKNEGSNKYEESDRYTFSEIECIYDDELDLNYTLVFSPEGKQGVLKDDMTVDWK